MAVGGDSDDRIRRYMQDAYAKPVREEPWTATTRSVEDLEAAALAELAQGDGGPATLELAARAVYPLITTLRLWADRGSRGSDQPDRRQPGEVIDLMRRSERGVRQLARALDDHSAGKAIRAVDDTGAVIRTADGAQDVQLTDRWVREAFPPAGKVKAPRAPDTAREHLQAKLADLSSAVFEVQSTMKAARVVTGADGTPLVESEGIDRRHADEWREILGKASDDLLVWAARWRPLTGDETIVSTEEDEEIEVLDGDLDEAREGAELAEDEEAA